MTKKDRRIAGDEFASKNTKNLKNCSREIRAQDLRQLYYLKREIKEQQRRIEELETLATKCTSRITGMPHGLGISDKVGKYASEISDLKNLLDLNIKKCFFELNKLDRYIQSVNDSETRMILTLRYMNGMSWKKISQNMGCYGDGSTERKKHNRFLKVSLNS